MVRVETTVRDGIDANDIRMITSHTGHEASYHPGTGRALGLFLRWSGVETREDLEKVKGNDSIRWVYPYWDKLK